jgi:hypothetical protein
MAHSVIAAGYAGGGQVKLVKYPNALGGQHFEVRYYHPRTGFDVDRIVDPVRAIERYEDRCVELLKLLKEVTK